MQTFVAEDLDTGKVFLGRSLSKLKQTVRGWAGDVPRTVRVRHVQFPMSLARVSALVNGQNVEELTEMADAVYLRVTAGRTREVPQPVQTEAISE